MRFTNTHAQSQWLKLMSLSLSMDISGMGRNSSLQLIICFSIVSYLLAWSRVQTSHCLVPKSCTNMSIGAVLDLASLMGKQQKIAMEIAVEEFNINQVSSSKMDLQIKDSHGNSAQVIASGNIPSNFLSCCSI